MPYVLQMSAQYSDAELGVVTKKWVIRDDKGLPLLFANKRAALEHEGQMSSGYDGIAYWNVYSHGQLSGSPAVPKWVSSDPDERPYWAR